MRVATLMGGLGFGLAISLVAAAQTSVPPATPPPGTPPAAEKPSQRPGVLLHAVMGKEVRSLTGERMGTVVNVLVDDDGKLRAAVIDFGGFLGVGVRKIAVDWNALSFAPERDGERISANLTRDEVKSAPEFKDGQPIIIVTAPAVAEPTQ
jgi:hypothetical protein